MYSVGFVLSLLVSFLTARTIARLPLLETLLETPPAWRDLPFGMFGLLLVGILLMSWYGAHVTMALNAHRSQKPLPTTSESLARIPSLLLAGAIGLFVVAGPLFVALPWMIRLNAYSIMGFFSMFITL